MPSLAAIQSSQIWPLMHPPRGAPRRAQRRDLKVAERGWSAIAVQTLVRCRCANATATRSTPNKGLEAEPEQTCAGCRGTKAPVAGLSAFGGSATRSPRPCCTSRALGPSRACNWGTPRSRHGEEDLSRSLHCDRQGLGRHRRLRQAAEPLSVQGCGEGSRGPIRIQSRVERFRPRRRPGLHPASRS
jgi:hypothetical protein